MKKALVIAGSRGIGKGVSDSLKNIEFTVFSPSSSDLDTSDLDNVRNYILDVGDIDVLVLNTGGPPARNFYDITVDEWDKYYRQLFLSSCIIMKEINLNSGAFVFNMSSFNIKEPDPKLILSNAFRVAFVSVLKSLSKELAHKNISCITIAPGPIKTDRLTSLVDDMDQFEKGLPFSRAGEASEIGEFVSSIVEKNIKYLSGVTINFDGAASNSLF